MPIADWMDYAAAARQPGEVEIFRVPADERADRPVAMPNLERPAKGDKGGQGK